MKNISVNKKIIYSSIFLAGVSLNKIFAMEPPSANLGADISSVESVKDNINVRGVVIDENGEPLIGVSVLVVGTTTGVITDFDGNFSISVPDEKAKLRFSYVGCVDQNVVVGKNRTLKIVLKEDSEVLEEVVVVGYGTQKKISTTASVVSMGNKELLQAPTASVAQALSGRMPGLTSIQQSGLPGGDSPILRVRGISTLSSDYESAPLVLVDGIERSFDQLDPNEIESISVLKDASSTAVFGVRGANGVIIVTTKRGGESKPTVNWSSDLSIQVPINVPDMLPSGRYGELLNEANHNDGNKGVLSQTAIDAYNLNANRTLYPNIDWFDYLLNDYSMKHQHNVNVSGGTKNVKYFVSLGYLHQGGLWRQFNTGYDNNTTFDRYNFRSNLDFSLSKTTKFQVSLGGRIEERHQPNTDMNSYFGYVYGCPPNSSAGVVDGKVILYNKLLGARNEPITKLATDGYRQNMASTVELNLDLEQKLDFITKGLKAKVTYAYDSYYAYNQTFDASIPKYYVDEAIDDIDNDGIDDRYVVYAKSGNEGPLSRTTSYGKNRKMYFSTSLNYDNTFANNHNVGALVLYNMTQEWFPKNIGMDYIPRAYLGLVGRLTYNYGYRYLFEFNMGYNGSENFMEGKRFGFFPALSVGYVLSEEKFMQGIKDVMSYFKLKYSYGKVGNDKVGSGNRFLYTPSSWGWVNSSYIYFGQDATLYPGASEGKVSNPDVTWEVAYKQNLALESIWFDNRLTFNIDLFKENRQSILAARRTIPSHVAATFQPANIGKVDSYGYEIELGWRDKVGDFDYGIKSNFSFNRNKIVEFDEVKKKEEWLNETGHRIGQYHGLICTGIFETPEQLTDPNLPTYPVGTPQLGDLMYLDYNEDGVIDYRDVLPIGYSQFPEINYGVNLNLGYKNWSLSVLFQGTGNVSNYYSAEVRQPFVGEGGIFAHQENSWRPETAETAIYPRLTAQSKHNNYLSSTEIGGFAKGTNIGSTYWLKDASYVRLKNVELSYLIKSKFLKEKAGINNIRVYVNGNNLLTWSKLKIFDPESTPGGPYRYPQLATYNIGFKLQF